MAKTTKTRNLAGKLKDIDRIVAKAMKVWSVPGLAIGVVHDQEIVLTKGYGYRDLEKKLPFTGRTVSVIGSCTKAMTATCLGILVDQGKIAWDKPVRQYLPWFALSDAFAGERVTPRDLVSHRTGLPGHDRMWYGSDLSRRKLIERLKYLPLSCDVRTNFQYNNIAYAAAAMLIEEVSGLTWEDFMRQYLLGPLGMDTRCFTVDRMQQAAEYAQPYHVRQGKPVRVPHYELPQIGPAGPTAFCAVDMCQWLKLNLGVGKFGEQQIVSEDGIKFCQRPTMWVGGVIGYPPVCHVNYGMGWFITDFRGRHYINHGGGISGFSSFVSLLPNEKFGAVVLCNAAGSPALGVTNSSIHDRLLGLEPMDRIQQVFDDQKNIEQRAKANPPAAPPARKMGTRPTHALEDYAGEYFHPGYGSIAIKKEGRGLTAKFHRDRGVLKHYHYDVFDWVEESGRNARLSFQMDRDGRIVSLGAPFEPALAEIVFVKKS
ncbi:MAG: serine hydrolase [Phycisphaeraceae bacterium]|nr:serine hydrolase [Phycisphaeraceae bacterium]